jgi:opacity protein-like surface antigen
MKKLNLLLLAFMLLGTTAFAKEVSQKGGFYAGGAINTQSVYADEYSVYQEEAGQDHTTGLTAVAGYQNVLGSLLANSNFSLDVEGRVSKSLGDQDFADILTYGVYIKPDYALLDNVLHIYALIGVGQVNVEDDSSGATMLDDTTFQWGLGLSTPLQENLSLFVDYTSLAMDVESSLNSNQELNSDAINIGLTYLF